MIYIKSFVFNPFMENTYVLYDDTKECVVIDPGCYEEYEKKELKAFIVENDLKVVKLLNTHCHIDHVLGNEYVKKEFNVELYVHQLDEQTLRSVKVYAPSYGFTNYEEATVDQHLDEGDIVEFGESKLDVIFVPGHAPGHIAFISKADKICIGGDVLFQSSIGRTDLPGGDFDTLINSIHSKIFPLGEDFTVYCGHGPATNVGTEKKSNPFCAVA
ncbi:MBL fold metallo-hydrolase [Fulvivirga sp. 29W222]|uniref:MBL fold metallo-hydrolase n=1 Tax=Fulvivirga marina TaxID=2494733 RepID=A0A937KA96_9BACT|nr:MBL fold metallo-hydrolase [Fulvivirga marina]MBL6444931.1 MBL fold metallo-hydrolase [Fulvivirga marina]